MSPEFEQYKRNGFFIAKRLLDEETISNVKRSLNKTLADQLAAIAKPQAIEDIFDGLKALHDLDIQRYIKVLGALWRKHSIFNLMHDTRITRFLHDNFGWGDLFLPGGQVIHIMANELKVPNGYFGLVPHQDFPSVQGSLDGVVVWLPLVDVDKDNYPLEIVPGSHKRGLAPMVNHGTSTWEVDKTWYDERDFVSADVAVGDVIFMSMFAIHRSSTNGSDGRCRISVSTRFDNADEPTFVERAYPTAYIRSVHREQYFEGFPDVAQVARVFRPGL
jgi:ectoine hydroxylase-related dioxygenase (phytanoyl-CoA dioxygenase family)